jgi:hypothetical protein
MGHTFRQIPQPSCFSKKGKHFLVSTFLLYTPRYHIFSFVMALPGHALIQRRHASQYSPICRSTGSSGSRSASILSIVQRTQGPYCRVMTQPPAPSSPNPAMIAWGGYFTVPSRAARANALYPLDLTNSAQSKTRFPSLMRSQNPRAFPAGRGFLR